MDDVALPDDHPLAPPPALAVVLTDPTAAPNASAGASSGADTGADVDVDAASAWMAQARELVLAALEDARSR